MNKLTIYTLLIVFTVFLINCEEDYPYKVEEALDNYIPTPYELKIPLRFPTPKIPADNPFTVEGVSLGRHLFWDPILSKDSTLACAGCHAPNAGFGDELKTSAGVDGIHGKRNSMPLFNLAWSPAFLWDGSATTLEEQILNPVRDPIEMHLDWKTAAKRLSSHPTYPTMFAKAFGSTTPIDSTQTAKAIAQFLRTMISSNSKFDKAFGISSPLMQLSDEELLGHDSFVSFYPDGAHCNHCHGGILFSNTDDYFRNNGLDAWEDASELEDWGLGGHTGRAEDIGKFKSVSLRNIELTAPYMHDGRFETLKEAVDHYIAGGHESPTVDFIMKLEFLKNPGLRLPEGGRENLIAFLKTLTDWEFVNDTAFQSPF